jgi:hypothetical protein
LNQETRRAKRKPLRKVRDSRARSFEPLNPQ